MYTPEMPLEPTESRRRVFCYCDYCFEPIFEGDELWKIGDHTYCEDCIRNAHHYYTECTDIEEQDDFYMKTPWQIVK